MQAELIKNPNDTRLLSQLCQDTQIIGRYEDAIGAGIRYLELWHEDPTQCGSPDEAFGALYRLCTAYIQTGEYRKGVEIAHEALMIRGYALGWALVAEAAHQLATQAYNKRPLCELAIFAADKALEIGHTTTTFPSNPDNVQIAPYRMKANAYMILAEAEGGEVEGQFRHNAAHLAQAQSAISLALRLEPRHEGSQRLMAHIEDIKRG
jgi:tetratricopeptide (TPR) repeat protein